MAYDDIQILSSTGWTPRIMHYRMDAAEAFSKGDVVVVADTGQLQEALTTGPLPGGLTGIAMAGSIGIGGITLTNPRTNAAYAENDMIPVSLPDINTWYYTKNYTEGTAFNDVAPVSTLIGDQVGLVSISGVWGVDQGQDANEGVARVQDVLNSQKESIQVTGETLTTSDTYWIVFQIVAHQGTPDSAEAPAPISET